MTTTTTTKTVPVSELSGAALDWAVAKCKQGGKLPDNFNPHYAMPYSTNWNNGGSIIEREGIAIGCVDSDHWLAHIKNDTFNGFRYGPSPLVAAMRCYVASKLGDTVEVPVELLD